MSDTTSTVTDAGTVVLAGTTYTVRHQVTTWTDRDGVERSSDTLWLTGPRGGVFFLRGFLYRDPSRDTGVHQVISWKSGVPLRVRGNEVRALVLGDLVEEYRGRR